MTLNPCSYCQTHGMALCPRHGLERPTKKPKMPLFDSGLKRTRPLKPVSDKRKGERMEWAGWKSELLERQKRMTGRNFCECCGEEAKPDALDADHIIPSGKGGEWALRNMQLLRRKCHNAKHRNLPEWSEK